MSSKARQLTYRAMLFSALLLPLAAFPRAAGAGPSEVECAPWMKNRATVLTGARLFDGPPADAFDLAPDGDVETSWDISGYKASDRTIYLVCDYKGGVSNTVALSKSLSKCYLSRDKRVAAWCVK